MYAAVAQAQLKLDMAEGEAIATRELLEELENAFKVEEVWMLILILLVLS